MARRSLRSRSLSRRRERHALRPRRGRHHQGPQPRDPNLERLARGRRVSRPHAVTRSQPKVPVLCGGAAGALSDLAAETRREAVGRPSFSPFLSPFSLSLSLFPSPLSLNTLTVFSVSLLHQLLSSLSRALSPLSLSPLPSPLPGGSTPTTCSNARRRLAATSRAASAASSARTASRSTARSRASLSPSTRPPRIAESTASNVAGARDRMQRLARAGELGGGESRWRASSAQSRHR